ncbi:MAG: DUF4129 domain-containing protein [Cyclobacteriaceae bacterium]
MSLNSLWAQSSEADVPITDQQQVDLRSFDQQKWEEATKDVKFEKPEKEKKKEEEKEEKSKTSRDWSFGSWDFGGLQNLLFIVAIGLLLFFVIRLLNSQFLRKEKKIATEVSEVNFEDDLENQDLQSFLDKALQNKDYKQAIRLYYLMIIQDLNQKGWIKWERDKTNSRYVREMASQTSGNQFREITSQFNFIWYGDHLVDEAMFTQESPKFQKFIDQIKERV